MIRFSVPGRAESAGSKRAFPFHKLDGKLGVRVSDDNPKAAGWKQLVALHARAAYDGPALVGPVRLDVTFRVTRPKSHFNSKGKVKPTAPWLPVVKPDLLKLARGLEDALTGIVYVDDAQIVCERLSKVYADRSETVVEITLVNETSERLLHQAVFPARNP